VGAGADARRHAEEHALPRGEALQALQLVEGVGDHVPHACLHGLADLLLGLVVAVEVDARRVDAAAQGEEQLAARGHVDGEPLLGEEAEERGAGEGLARVDHLEVVRAGPEGLLVGPRAGADVVLGVDVGRRAELLGELEHVAPAHLEAARGPDPGPEGIDVAQGPHCHDRRRMIAQGSAPTPSPRTGRERGLAWSLFLPEGEPRAGVMVLHGWGSCKENHFDFARRAHAAGVATLLYDARGHGATGGRLGPEAVDDAVAMAALLGSHAPRVGLRGSSMGGFVALHAAARAPGPAAVVAVCPAPGVLLLDGLREGRLDGVPVDRPALDAWLTGADLEPAVRALAGRTALLLQHAEGDESVPVASTRALFEAAGEPKALRVVPGGDHRSAQHDPVLQDESIAFIRGTAP
jgi:fermentation-respiration switch protein FrsA (DUF1100 family)